MFNTIITKEVDCPECFKVHNDTSYRYVDIMNEDKEVIGHMALGFPEHTKECLAHLVFELWSRGSFKAFKTALFSVVVPGLKELGIKKINVVNSTKDRNKWTRFMKLVNFSEPVEYLHSSMEL